uniref:Uncharacterized protein n=1 Tax=Coccidioides posadasii RMSCC 3488 TaxID=454284 RepID=A0A0J6HYK1_COCPO|nr:hypothetical protein CPAG_00404 [Coccidioides posadasii RMSCC 3488]
MRWRKREKKRGREEGVVPVTQAGFDDDDDDRADFGNFREANSNDAAAAEASTPTGQTLLCAAGLMTLQRTTTQTTGPDKSAIINSNHARAGTGPSPHAKERDPPLTRAQFLLSSLPPGDRSKPRRVERLFRPAEEEEEEEAIRKQQKHTE